MNQVRAASPCAGFSNMAQVVTSGARVKTCSNSSSSNVLRSWPLQLVPVDSHLLRGSIQRGLVGVHDEDD